MRNVILFCWRLIDPVYFLFTRLTYVDNQKNIFRVRLTRYRGHSVVLTDGTHIEKNDLLVKIHFHNARLLSDLKHIQNDFQKGRMFYYLVKESLPGIAHYLKKQPQQDQIKGLIGITSLKIRSNRLGFETFSIKNKFYKLIKSIAFLPINLLSSGELRNKQTNEPVYFFMSKDVLLERYSGYAKNFFCLDENAFVEGDVIS